MANNMLIFGNVVADVEVKTSQSGKAFARGRVAASRQRLGADKKPVTDFFNFVIFEERKVEFAERFLKKGTNVFLTGQMHDDVYEKDGVKQYSKILYVSDLGFGGGESAQSITVEGRLTKDPEIRYTTGEKPMAVARFSLAVSKPHKEGEDGADFFNTTCFGKSAESLEKFIHKGDSLMVSGELQTEEYTDRDGNKRKSVMLVANRVVFGKKREDGANAPATEASAPATGSTSGFSVDADGFMNIPDGIEDELPFN